ncbi:hypothetical protein IJ425_00915, partial [bacterium]|nr:hypothetical protein [bacterium]
MALAADGTVSSYSDFIDNVYYAQTNITFLKNINATTSDFPEFSTSDLTTVDGGNYNLYGNGYGGFLNTGNLKIINFGSISDSSYSAGITGYIGYQTSAAPETAQASPTYNQYGGAFSNIGGTLEIVDTVISDNSAGYGGAIYNAYDGYLSLENVVFDSNKADMGSAIFNGSDGTINYITNSTFKDNFSQKGGTLVNLGKIGDITDSIFEGNTSSGGGEMTSGVINNWGEINTIKADFISNAEMMGSVANFGDIQSIEGNFDGNIGIMGSAILNYNFKKYMEMQNSSQPSMLDTASSDTPQLNHYAAIKYISGTFTNNTGYIGGAVVNFLGDIKSIDAKFENNTGMMGAALLNFVGNIGSIKGEFNNNIAQVPPSSEPEVSMLASSSNPIMGGAIINAAGAIDEIDVSFVGNSGDYYAGAILNVGYIKDIKGTFDSNYAEVGGAIFNGQTDFEILGNLQDLKEQFEFDYDLRVIDSIAADFKNNEAMAGGAIVNNTDSIIGEINSNFEANNAEMGGAIMNKGQINKISGVFDSNTSYNNGGAIYNGMQPKSADISEDNAINNFIGYIEGEFSNNISFENNGGAIYNAGMILSLNADFKNNLAYDGGAIYNDYLIGLIQGEFIGNIADYNSMSRMMAMPDSKGGAIYNSGFMNIGAIDRNTVFSANMANGESNAIHNSYGTINLHAANDYSVIINDAISGNYYFGPTASGAEAEDSAQSFMNENTININIADNFIYNENGEQVALPTNGTIEINNTIDGNQVNLFDGTLKLGHHLYTEGENPSLAGQMGIGQFTNDSMLGIYGGTLSLQDGA